MEAILKEDEENHQTSRLEAQIIYNMELSANYPLNFPKKNHKELQNLKFHIFCSTLSP